MPRDLVLGHGRCEDVPMRILLWHGYLLGGTGSNVYTRSLAREWSRAGHDVTVFAQEPRPEEYDLGGASVVRPDIGGLLPTFVLDEYEGMEVRLVQDLTADERERYVTANAKALRAHLPADLVFANHVVLGGPVAARDGAPGTRSRRTARSSSTRCVGTRSCRAGGESRLQAPRRCSSARSTSAGCSTRSSATSTACTSSRRAWTSTSSSHCPRDEALRDLIAESRADPPNPGNANERLPDEGNADRLEAFLAEDEPTVLYFGKLLRNKGVHVLFEALRDVDARAVVVGFGDYREELERTAPPRTLFTGPLEHRHLAKLIPLAHVTGGAVDLPRGVRNGRRRGGRRRIAPARREPLRPRGDRRRSRRRVPGARTAT